MWGVITRNTAAKVRPSRAGCLQSRSLVVRRFSISSTADAQAAPPASSSHTPSPRQAASWRPLGTALLLGLFGGATYFLGVVYPPESLLFLFPRTPAALPSAGSSEADRYIERLDKEILALPQVRELLASASSPPSEAGPSSATQPVQHKAHYVLSRPFANFPKDARAHSLTAGSLRQPGMLAVPAVVISKTRHGARSLGGHIGDGFAFVHLGRNLCGHQGLVHGGLLATVLDETLARTAFYHLPSNVGVTARLEIDYKHPVKADSFIVVQTELIHHEGRKAWVQATMRDLHGKILVQSKALFVEPRLAKLLDTRLVSRVLDRKDDEE